MNYENTRNRNVTTMRETTTETNPKSQSLSQSGGSKKWSFTGLFKRKEKPKAQTVPVTIQFDPTEELIHQELFGTPSSTTPPTDTTDAPPGKFLKIPGNSSRSSPSSQTWQITKKQVTLSNNPSPLSASLEERTSLSKYQQSTRARAAARRESLLLTSSSDDETCSGSQTSINRALRRKKINHSPLVSSSPNLNVPSSPKWEARVIYTQSTVEDTPVVTVKLPLQQQYYHAERIGNVLPVESNTDPIYANLSQDIPPPIPPRREFNKKYINFHRPVSCSYLDNSNRNATPLHDLNGNTKFGHENAPEIVAYEAEPKSAYPRYNNNIERNFEQVPRMEDTRLNSSLYQNHHNPATATLSNGSTSLSLSSLSRGTPSPNTFQKTSVPASFAPIPLSRPSEFTPNNKTTPKKNLEEALNELEEMYKSLRLSDEDLLDRAERRDLPTPHQELRDKPLGNPSYSRRFLFSPPGSLESIATTGSSTDSRRVRQRAPPMRRSACPDLVNDDMAKRFQSPRQINKSDPRELAGKSGSYLAMSPVFSPPVSPSPVLRDYSDTQIMFTDSPDLTLDDVTFRNIKRANAIHLIEEPQPPFGIPIGPITAAPTSDYLHSTPVEKYRPLYRHVKIPDLVKDDVAFRSLRKDLNSENNNLNKDWTPKLFKGQMNISPEKMSKKDRAVRSMSANITNMKPKWNVENNRNNNIWLEALQQNRSTRSMTPNRANYLEPSWVEQVEIQAHPNPFKVRNWKMDQSAIPPPQLIHEKQAIIAAMKTSPSPTPRKPWTDIILDSFKDDEAEQQDTALTSMAEEVFYDASEFTPRETPYETAGEKSSPELETLMADPPTFYYQTQLQRPGSFAEPQSLQKKMDNSKRQSWSEPKQFEDYSSAFNAIMNKNKKIEHHGWNAPTRAKQISLESFQMGDPQHMAIDQVKPLATSKEEELNELIDALVRDADGLDNLPYQASSQIKTEFKAVPIPKDRKERKSLIPIEYRSKPPVQTFGGVAQQVSQRSQNDVYTNYIEEPLDSELRVIEDFPYEQPIKIQSSELKNELELKTAFLPSVDQLPNLPLEVSKTTVTLSCPVQEIKEANKPTVKCLISDNESTASTSSDTSKSIKPRKSRRKRENSESIDAKWQAAITEMENSHKIELPSAASNVTDAPVLPSPPPQSDRSSAETTEKNSTTEPYENPTTVPVKKTEYNQHCQDFRNPATSSIPKVKPQPSPRTSISLPDKKLIDSEGFGIGKPASGVYKIHPRWGPTTASKKKSTFEIPPKTSMDKTNAENSKQENGMGYGGVQPVIGRLPIGLISKSSTTTDLNRNKFQLYNKPSMVNMTSGVKKFLNLNQNSSDDELSSTTQNQPSLCKSSSADNAALWSKFKLSNSKNINNLIQEKATSYVSIPQEQQLNNVAQMAQHFMKLENAQRYRQPLKTVHNHLESENIKQTNTKINSNSVSTSAQTPELQPKQGCIKSLRPKMNDYSQPCADPSKLSLKERIKLFNECNSGSEIGSQEKICPELCAKDKSFANQIEVPRTAKVKSSILSRSADDLSEGEYSSGGQEVNEIISKSYENSPIASRKKSWSSKPSYFFNLHKNPSGEFSVNNDAKPRFLPSTQWQGRNGLIDNYNLQTRPFHNRPVTTSNLLPVLTALSSSDEAIPNKTYHHVSLKIGTARF